jgi:hypothetical protein
VDVVGLRRRIAVARLELTMEANIHCLAELYESVAGKAKRSSAAAMRADSLPPAEPALSGAE